jgi:transcription-repair coupling factor (superfamily II helicase)
MRDLELRGSGNLLGPQQSGQIAGVGFELYCELLKESVQKLKTAEKGKSFVPRTTVRFDFPFDTRIPADYLPEARLRLELNRELSLCENKKDFEELKASIVDRFGAPPKSVQNLQTLNELRILAHEKGIISLNTEGDRLKLMKPDGNFFKDGPFFPRIGGESPGQKIKAVFEILKNL